MTASWAARWNGGLSCFTTGGAGVGKSTLQGLIKRTLGRAMLDTTDTTQAGIYQRVRNDCLPVMVDELENKAGSSRRRRSWSSRAWRRAAVT